jgi:hypothetical protein
MRQPIPNRAHEDPASGRLRNAVQSATWPLREAAWAVEERVVWPSADRFRAAAQGVSEPIEQLAFNMERRVVWPLQDSTEGWSRGSRSAAAGALAAAAIAAGAAGALTASSGDEPVSLARAEPAATRALATPPPAGAPAPDAPAPQPEPVLQGTPPKFERAVAEQEAGAHAGAAPAARPIEPGAARKPAPAEAGALRVARRFAEAFVLYEIGEADARVRRALESTTTPGLAKALRRRPPHQPADVDVPRARVLNVVLGPRHRDRVSVSASLLRVGTTSELRLDLRRTTGGWQVTDVRG